MSIVDKRMTPLNVGELSDGWKNPFLGEISHSVANGFVGQSVMHQTEDRTAVRYIQGTNVRPNKIVFTNRNSTYVKLEFHDQHKKSQLYGDEILTVQSGHIGTTAVVPKELAGSNCHAVIITRPDFDKVDPHYISYYMNSTIGQARMKGLHVGSTILHINTSELAKYRIPLPPKEEQVQIASVFKKWDQSVALTERRVAISKKNRKALMQQLLTGKRRFPGFTQPWKEVEIGDVLEEIDRPIDMEDEVLYKLASVRRNWGGVFDRGHLQGNEIKTKNLREIKEGDFLIAHIQSAYGSLAIVPKSFDGYMVSNLYTCLKPIDESKFNLLFFGFLARQPRMTYLCRTSSNGFFAERLRLNFMLDVFLTQKIKIPPTIEEQNKIIETLDLADKEINLLEKQLAAYQQQKRGLMQQLLTGKRRVKIAAE